MSGEFYWCMNQLDLQKYRVILPLASCYGDSEKVAPVLAEVRCYMLPFASIQLSVELDVSGRHNFVCASPTFRNGMLSSSEHGRRAKSMHRRYFCVSRLIIVFQKASLRSHAVRFPDVAPRSDLEERL